MGVESQACRQMLVDCVLKTVDLFSARGLLRLRTLAESKAEAAFVRLLVVSRFPAWIPGVMMNAF